jgi:2-hydroxychromene-2-carboxylate isomerase
LAADPDRDRIAARALELGLQPLRWPSVWPPDSETAMLAATYAKHIGRAVSFTLAAFRQAFAGGRDLGDEATVLLAAAACEMHPAAVLKGVELRSITTALIDTGARALAAGARSLPAIGVRDELFDTPDCIERADAALGARR